MDGVSHLIGRPLKELQQDPPLSFTVAVAGAESSLATGKAYSMYGQAEVCLGLAAPKKKVVV